MRTPSVRAASTKPAAAIVFPDAVGWRARPRLAGVHFGDRVVEGTAAGGAGRERLLDVFAGIQEWLARPRLGAVCSSGKCVRRLGEGGRLNGFLHVRSTSIVLQTSKGA